MTGSTVKAGGSRGAGRSPTLGRGSELGAVSVGLGVAGIEFALCGAILLALRALGVVSTETAQTWAAVILVPLAATIGYLGIQVGLLSRRAARGGHEASPANLPQVA